MVVARRMASETGVYVCFAGGRLSCPGGVTGVTGVKCMEQLAGNGSGNKRGRHVCQNEDNLMKELTRKNRREIVLLLKKRKPPNYKRVLKYNIYIW